MFRRKIFLIGMLAWINVANAEFNIENNLNQPVYIKLGYQNVLNSSFIYTDVSKNVDLKKKYRYCSIWRSYSFTKPSFE